jgi:uncharacterized protein (DUF58 family)
MATSTTFLELTPRGRLMASLGVAATAAAWLAGDPHARLAAAMLLAPLLLDLWWKPLRLHRTQLQIGARRGVVGVPFLHEFTLTAPPGPPLHELSLQEPRTMRNETPLLLPALLPGKPVPCALRGRNRQRGHLLERVFVLATAWPFGLVRARAILAVAADLVVEPARTKLPATAFKALSDRTSAPHSAMQLEGPEFHSLREYQPGEDARLVHPLRSASLGTLVRRVTRGALPRSVGLVLDLRQQHSQLARQRRQQFEWGLAAAITLAQRSRSLGIDLDVLVLSAEPVRLLVNSPLRLEEFGTLLAESTPSPAKPLAAALFAHLEALEHCYWIAAGDLPVPADLKFAKRLTLLTEGQA